MTRPRPRIPQRNQISALLSLVDLVFRSDFRCTNSLTIFMELPTYKDGTPVYIVYLNASGFSASPFSTFSLSLTAARSIRLLLSLY